MGTELVDWMLQQTPCVHSRTQAVGMWQVLVEDGVLNHGKMSHAPWKTLKKREVCFPVLLVAELPNGPERIMIPLGTR